MKFKENRWYEIALVNLETAHSIAVALLPLLHYSFILWYFKKIATEQHHVRTASGEMKGGQ